ncbi:flagellar motor protein MotB [Salinisphaera sp. T31B1]|uniref:flagellar motor protein MotB n=1 Tax=Salinisphaera sp. T31B1 TaxID=727963 RepID=UPI0033410735
MSGAESRRPIIVKRKRPVAKHGAHGTWKIAYADFMTAMMAFFLVMWLLGGLSDTEMEQVGDYFRTPLSVAIAGGDRSSASDSVIPGGGADPTRTDGMTRMRFTPDATTVDRQRLDRLKRRLESLIHQDPALNAMSSQIKIDIVQDGLRIQIFDDRNRPMFELGSAHIQPYIRDLLAAIAPRLDTMPNRIILTGHTDDLRYAGGAASYGNWELSSDRANAARRALVAAGYSPDKLLRVIGAAATQRLPGDGPSAAVNRRISILVLNAAAEQRIQSEGQALMPPPAPRRPAAQSADGRPGPGTTPAAQALSLIDGDELFVGPWASAPGTASLF